MKACLIGGKLRYSFSKTVHEKLGTDYDLVEVADEKLGEFVNSRRYDFFNVTIPHKKSVVRFLNKTDATVDRTGCVNTVVCKDDVVGYNTDLFGIEFVFERCKIDVRGKHAVVLGSGATSQTVCEYLHGHGAQSVTVVGRTSKFNYQNYARLSQTQILVNTTPVGTYPDCDRPLVNLSVFARLEFVFDVVYNPLKTKLILQAENIGIPCAGGLAMLVAQAVRSEEIWQNKPLVHLTESLLCEVRRDLTNVVLVGMPSCGKTVVGKALAQKLNKRFVDLDTEAESCGLTVEEIILRHGEKYFREIESKNASKFGKEHGLVIATGGGTVLNNENVVALRQNACMVWLQRDLPLLSSKNRPLSKLVGVEKLFEQRKELYAKAADCCVFNNDDLSCAVSEIANVFERWVEKQK